MKIGVIADLHLGSKAIGDGRWKLDAIERVIVPKLRDLSVTHLLFAGDTLDFTENVTRLPNERPELIQFAAAQFGSLSVPTYLLMGNHDDVESCTFWKHMGGPEIIQDGWMELGSGVGAFLMRGRQNKQDALQALEGVDVSRFERKILVLHEDLDVLHDEQFLSTAQAKFDLVLNGHNHVYRQVRDKVYLLPACLPWQPRRGSQCDLEVKRSAGGEVTKNPKERPWGLVFLDEDLVLQFVPLDVGVRIAICEVEASEEEKERAIRQTLDVLADDPHAKSLVVRMYVSARVDESLREEVSRDYSSLFFDNVQIQLWRGAGVVSRELRDRLPTEEAALEVVRTRHGEKARQMVEQLSRFFQYRSMDDRRKKSILEIVQKHMKADEADGPSDSSPLGS